MSRSSVDLPQPDGPMSETNSPGAIERLMSSRAVVRPPAVSKTLLTPEIATTLVPGCPLTSASPEGRVRPAAKREQLQQPDGDEEGQAEQRGGDHRRPELLRTGDVLLVEVEDRAPESELAAARVPLPHDRPDDARGGRDLERREQVRQRGGHAQLPED